MNQVLVPAGSSQEAALQQARSIDTPASVLAELLRDDDPWIRGAAVSNPCVPAGALGSLANDLSPHVTRCLQLRERLVHPFFSKPQHVRGYQLVLRDATITDAAFILSLRTDAQKSRHLSHTSPGLQAQQQWLAGYAGNDEQVYFIIENMQGERLGAVRLYDQQGVSFCWGSWIIKDGAPASVAIESALMVYRFGIALGFTASHFDVRKGNTSVWRFHERFGAERSGESDLDFYYRISLAAMASSLEKYQKYLPGGIVIA